MDLREYYCLFRLLDLAQRHRVGQLSDRLYLAELLHGFRVVRLTEAGSQILCIIEAIIKRLRLTGLERRDCRHAIVLLTSGRLQKRLLAKLWK